MVLKVPLQNVWQRSILQPYWSVHTKSSVRTRNKNCSSRCPARTYTLRSRTNTCNVTVVGVTNTERKVCVFVLWISSKSTTAISKRAFVEQRKVCRFSWICATRSDYSLCEKSKSTSHRKPHPLGCGGRHIFSYIYCTNKV